MHLRAPFLVLIGALTSSCALPTQDRDPTRAAWSYNKNLQRPPIATYGLPNTAVQMSLVCDPSKAAIHIEFVDSEIDRDRPIELAVGNTIYRGIERLDPPDGMAVSRITVPWNEVVLDRYAAGNEVMMVITSAEKFAMPTGRLPRLMVRDCLNMRH